MAHTLTYAQSIMVLFQLGLLVTLWGIYTEVRKLGGNASDEKE